MTSPRFRGAKALGVRAGAGALGGVAAGFVLLAAGAAPAAEPAADPAPARALASLDPVPVASLTALEPDGQQSSALHAMPEATLEPLSSDPPFRLAASPGWTSFSGDPLTCLAQAVYFEARSESKAGQEAVAQVVMNRTRLPQYAPTVCGVVYQGADRATGCQFTFVCDGALGPATDAYAWDKALAVARRALDGFVYRPMRSATHYHAAWIRPWWAADYGRIGRVDGQIFYH